MDEVTGPQASHSPIADDANTETSHEEVFHGL
jgi:hypothetical protein